MTTDLDVQPAATRDLGTPLCQVCGDDDLGEDSPHEFASGLSGRLVCRTCGAHRVTGTP